MAEAKQRLLASQSLIRFTEYTIPRWSAGKIHREIAAQLERVVNKEIDRLMLLCPPQHGKSSLTSKSFPAYLLGKDPTLDVISASASQPLAEGFGRDVRNCVASQEYRNVFPDTELAEDSQAKGRWNTRQGGSYFAVGVGGHLFGHGGLAIVDDPFGSWADAQSQIQRQAVWDWYRGTLYNRIRPGQPIIVIQHRMHEDDLAGRLIEAQKHGGDQWEIINLPALLDDPPWAERYDRAALERIRDNTDPRQWSALYLQNPTPEEGTYFKREWFRMRKETPIHIHKYLSSDFAVSEEDDADSTEIGIHGIDHEGTLHLCMDGWGGKKTADIWIEEYLSLVAKHKTLCEFNEAGVIRRSIEPFLIKRRRERNIYGRTEWITPITDKAARARSLQGLAAAGRVTLPDNEYGQRVLADLLKFPGSKDDHTVDMCALMALALADAHPGIVKAADVKKPRDRWSDMDDDDEIPNWKTA